MALFLEAAAISVYAGRFDPGALAGTTEGELDTFDYVDGLAGLVPHVRPRQVPLGAPLLLAGWALAAGAPPHGALAVLDDAHAFAIRADLRRPDIARERRDAAAVIGYRGVVPTDVLVPGMHQVSVNLVQDDGQYAAATVPFAIYASARPELAPVHAVARLAVDRVLDLADDESVMSVDTAVAQGRYALVSGWAIDLRTRRAPAGVTATDAQGRRWNAPCTVPRPDIQAAHGALDGRLGFELVVPTRALALGRHALRIAAYRADGAVSAHAIGWSFDVAAPERPFPSFVRDVPDAVRASAELTATLDGRDAAPVVLGRTSHASVAAGAELTVEGWALAPGAGAPAAADEVHVGLTLDGADVPPHRYPALAAFRRARAPRALGQPPVDDAWFKASFGTDGLAARTYRAELLVVDRGRRTVARAPLGTLAIVRPRG